MPNHQEYRTVGSALVSFFLERKRKNQLRYVTGNGYYVVTVNDVKAFLDLNWKQAVLAHRRGIWLGLSGSDFSHPFCGVANVDFRVNSDGGFVVTFDFALELLDVFIRNEVDGATPKTAARHSRSEYSRHVISKFHHQVELITTYLIVISQAAM